MSKNILYMLFFKHLFNESCPYKIQDLYNPENILTMIAYIISAEFAVDRAELLNQYSDFHIGVPTHIDGIEFDRDMKYENNSLEDICQEVAAYYIDKANSDNKKIGIMWSGGVDSTLALCSFLQNSQTNLNNLYVLLTDDSILENEYFFNNFIKDKIHYIKYIPEEYKQMMNMIYRDFIFISGHNGDQLFGHKFILLHPQFYGIDYTSVLENIYSMYLQNKDKKYVKNLVNKHLPIYKEYFANLFDFDIVTVENFVWALNFMCKWNWLRLDNILRCSNIDLINHHFTFFSHKLFQQWALYNKKYAKNPKQNPYTHHELYKKPFKEYIYIYDKNINYLNSKGKVASFIEYTSKETNNTFTLFSNNSIETHKICRKSKLDDNSKYKDIYELKKVLNKFRKN